MVDDGYGPKDMSDMEEQNNTKNRPQYVLFEPEAVSWGIGLVKAIENAQMMHVPLAVRSQKVLDSVKDLFPNASVIIVQE